MANILDFDFPEPEPASTEEILEILSTILPELNESFSTTVEDIRSTTPQTTVSITLETITTSEIAEETQTFSTLSDTTKEFLTSSFEALETSTLENIFTETPQNGTTTLADNLGIFYQENNATFFSNTSTATATTTDGTTEKLIFSLLPETSTSLNSIENFTSSLDDFTTETVINNLINNTKQPELNVVELTTTPLPLDGINTSPENNVFETYTYNWSKIIETTTEVITNNQHAHKGDGISDVTIYITIGVVLSIFILLLVCFCYWKTKAYRIQDNFYVIQLKEHDVSERKNDFKKDIDIP